MKAGRGWPRSNEYSVTRVWRYASHNRHAVMDRVPKMGMLGRERRHVRQSTSMAPRQRAIAAILATAPLFRHGIDASQFQAAQFAQALEPWIGHTGAALFALGIFEAGIVAAIAISAAAVSPS